MAQRQKPPRVVRRATLAGASAIAESELAVVVPSALDALACARIVTNVLAAERRWTRDFEGEQFSVGRAFYTHLEESKTADYFDDVERADALVDEVAPALQARMSAFIATATGAVVVQRRGFCGAGLHVFPAGGVVARRGGVIHYDTEGLARHHVARRKRALSFVLMLEPPARGGGLALWDLTYDGRDEATPDERRGAARGLVRYAVGDLAIFDSYRLHQIRPFQGERHRISATLHAAETDPGRWETWF